ncbi:class I SAM-dependent methyltransferase [Kurthia massiliensis]|uniref:class I SAM-dependent methyltransferase n=1 Tax=Kurthia massiliensis TaxID=1033739 RepID=UPI000287FA3B|nr:class I SAM-dependent methyltransferase [Kurthia massiliensis]
MQRQTSSLTSLVSTFTKAYHMNEDEPLIFKDTFANKLLLCEEYEKIAHSMIENASFFHPDIAKKQHYNPKTILQWIAHTQLCPTPLARAAFAEKIVLNEIMLGAEQYVILGAGLDTFALRHKYPNIRIFEVDHPATQSFKITRFEQLGIAVPTNVTFIASDFKVDDVRAQLIAAGFNPHKKTVFSLLGVTYYLTETALRHLLMALFQTLPQGSSIVFDVADEHLHTTAGIHNRVQHMVQMAAAAGEPMTFSTSMQRLEQLLADVHLCVYEQLSPEAIQQQYFAHRHDDLQAFETIHYVHAVKY